MAEVTVKELYIGASFKFQIVFPSDFASYTDIVAKIVSVNTDKQVISKSSKVANTGFRALVVDPLNPKACWVFIEASESAKAFETLYNCELTRVIPDTSYPSGSRTVPKVFPIVKFKAL